MCTVISLHRPGAAWPMLLAANRDEMRSRPWLPPAAHWPEYPGIVAGRDQLAGGTWMGMNRHGVVAAVLNRPGSLGPAPDRRSRGELPLLALAAATADEAARRIVALDAAVYRSFNMVVADAKGVVFLRGLEAGHPERRDLPPGLHITTAHDPDDPDSPRVLRHAPRFAAAPAPDETPDGPDWQAWRGLLADRADTPPGSALTVDSAGPYGTICASLVAIAADGRVQWDFAPGPADRAAFVRVAG